MAMAPIIGQIRQDGGFSVVFIARPKAPSKGADLTAESPRLGQPR